MKAMEEKAHKQGNLVNNEMRRVHREFQRMEDEIYDDVTLDNKTQKSKLYALQKAAVSTYEALSKRYPAAMRAQMLGSMQQLLLQ